MRNEFGGLISERLISAPVLENRRKAPAPSGRRGKRKMEDARSDREQQLRAQGWQEGGFGFGEENQHPGAKITAEITLLRCPGLGGGREGVKGGGEGDGGGAMRRGGWEDAREWGCPDPPGDAGPGSGEGEKSGKGAEGWQFAFGKHHPWISEIPFPSPPFIFFFYSPK